MATNYAEKYAPQALEAFAAGSYTQVFTGKYDWVDVKTVNVFTNATVAMGDYTPSAGFGTPTLIGNTKDTLTVAEDRAFSAIIDKLDMESTAGTMRAGEWLGTQLRQQVTPDVDKYRFDALFSACPSGQVSASAAITSANAYTEFLAGNEKLDEAGVPSVGRVCFITPQAYNQLKLDSNFIKASILAQDMLLRGQVGEVDGVPLIKVPSTTINATDNHVDFIIVHVDAVAAPIKLAEYEVHNTSEQYSGSRVNGRVVHDLFVLDALNTGIYAHIHAV